MNTLEIKKITKYYKKRCILNNISLELKTNEILVFFGRNGSGKSTLLQIIYGIIRANNIEIKINNKIISPKDIITSKKIAYLPQNTFLPKNLKIYQIIEMYFKNGAQQDKIFYAPRINKLQDKQTQNLSLGELRYLEIVLISNLRHEFLMLDEPFSMVEPLYVELIKESLKSIKKEKGVILTDHYYSDALEIADRMFLIKEGERILINDRKDLIFNEYIKRPL